MLPVRCTCRPAARWQLKTRMLTLRYPIVMGIVNATPDSFSDGGAFLEAAAAVDHGLKLAAEGADILDVGGESTRPDAEPVSEEEELRRVLPVVEQLARQTTVPISIDTSKAKVAWACLEAGAEIVNDVTALEGDPEMLAVVVQSQAGYCAMHMRGTPRTMQLNPVYRDVLEEVYVFLQQRRDRLLRAGVSFDRIALDPGIGFGKTHQHNLTLLGDCSRFHELGCPLLVGASRKGLIAKVLGDKTLDRTAGTIGVCLSLAAQGVQIHRVHSVGPVKQALKLFSATGGIDDKILQLPT